MRVLAAMHALGGAHQTLLVVRFPRQRMAQDWLRLLVDRAWLQAVLACLAVRLPCYLIHYRAPAWCRSAVATLLGSAGIDLLVTVVDNSAAEGVPADGLSPGVEVQVQRRNLGYAEGANRALADWFRRFPDSPFCLVGSHDLHVQREAIRALVEAAEAHPAFGIVGPVLPPGSCGPKLADGDTASSRVVEHEWTSGTCLLLRRDCVAEIGGFDRSFGSYVEDVDLCLRARDAGWRVGVVQGARATGLGSVSRKANSLILRNHVLLRAKRRGVRGAIAGLAWLFAGALHHLLKCLTSPDRDERQGSWKRVKWRLRALAAAPPFLVRMAVRARSNVPAFELGSPAAAAARNGAGHQSAGGRDGAACT